jgi:hypothetical protein
MLPRRRIPGNALATAAFVAAAGVSLVLAPPWNVLAQGQRGAGQGAGQQGQGQGGGQGRGQRGAGGGQGANQPTRDTSAQTATTGTGGISGTVTVEGAGSPARHARVTLAGAGLRPSRTATTGEQGQFSFTQLPAGRFTLTVSKPGYVDITYGAKSPGRPGTPIQLADGQTIDKLNVPLPKGSVITGIVIDENGEPSPGTQVRVMRYVMRTGEKTLQPAGTDTTDDRGVYRIYGQQPGDYLVSAVPRNANLGDLRQTMMAEVESLLQQAQAAGAYVGGVGSTGGNGAGGSGRQGGGRNGTAAFGQLNNYVNNPRGQALIDQANALQQQIQQQDQTQAVAYAPVYYPGTITSTSATTLTLALGEERGGVDFQLQLVPTARIDGTITSATGSLPQGIQIQIVPAGQAGMPNIPGMSMNMSRAGQDGRFNFTNVTPGQYTISARAAIRQQNQSEDAATAAATQTPQPGQPQGRGGFGPRGGGPGAVAQVLWASQDVTVNGQNLPDVVLNLQPGMTVSGRVVFQGSSTQPPTDLTRVRVTIQPRGAQTSDMGGIPPAQVDAGGQFKITGVPPGHYVMQANAPVGGQTSTGAAGGRGGGGGAAAAQTGGGWALKSALVDGRDSLDFPLEVAPNTDVGGAILTFTDRTQQLSGTLQDPSGRPTSDFTIVIFPADKTYWLPQSRRIQSTRPGTDGKYTLRGMPPGDYKVIAVTDVETGEWYDPDFLAQLTSAAMAISLGEGETKTQDLRVASGGGQ